MARRYAVAGNGTNTASATVPLNNITATAAVRPRIYDLSMGSDATPADNAAKYALQRASARGTQSTSITPQALDSADPAATLTSDTAWTVNPTLTASAFLLQWAQNQRATYRWVAAPYSELIIPATAGAGLALMSLVVGGSAVNMAYSILIEE